MHRYPTDSVPLASSFRDPSGSMFEQHNILYRGITSLHRIHWNAFIQSGLYRRLTEKNLLVPHKETSAHHTSFYKIIKPLRVPFISYPYEWCFSELKDAALLTLKIQKIALEHNMTLKDASAYNIQFLDGKPIFIDSLSFEKYQEGEPWIAYQQFCIHFLGPLLLMKYTHGQLHNLTQIYLDGVPLSIISGLLPKHTWFNVFILMHIHLQAKLQMTRVSLNTQTIRLPKKSQLHIIDQLETGISHLYAGVGAGEWGNYYQTNTYTKSALLAKKNIVSRFLSLLHPETVWDLGANTGLFSHVAAKEGATTVVSLDLDMDSVERNYTYCKQHRITSCHPLVMDITNPSPGRGWHNDERVSLWSRGPADVILCLALLHHLVIRQHIPFEKIAQSLSRSCRYLIVEYIPKEDEQVKRLLQNRRDIYYDYTQNGFESIFKKFFVITEKIKIPHSERTLYLLKNK